MANHLLVVMTSAIDGRDDEFNEWYDTLLLKEIVSLDGFATGQRFRLDDVHPAGVDDSPPGYLAIYEIPEDQLETAKASMAASYAERAASLAAGETPRVPLSPALARGASYWFTEIGEKLTSAN
ncbi:MAG: hypothetical protein JWO10_785 [Microbacteriaceae bacterium]|nr:hypothetical protein [Microbacteriaceae bacterium]